jgi:hypothetical protein
LFDPSWSRSCCAAGVPSLRCSTRFRTIKCVSCRITAAAVSQNR